MEFLKDVLGDEVFLQVKTKVEEYNEKNKDNEIKIANLSSGEYVGKGKYDSLSADYKNIDEKLKQANILISELQKGETDVETAKTKIKDYEATIASLNKRIEEEKKTNALKLALSKENAKDVDYLLYKLGDGKDLTIDENGNVVGIDDFIKKSKEQYPSQFEEKKDKKVLEHKHGDAEQGTEITKERFKKMGYKERLKLYNEDRETYNKLAK